MSPRLRLVLVISALLLVACALVALGYALWPLGSTALHSTLSATLFAPP